MAASDKIMFEIYREAGYARSFRVVYFTELDDHNKEQEISRAMAGDHLFDGFIAESHDAEAKETINKILDSLNDGQSLDGDEVGSMLGPYLAE